MKKVALVLSGCGHMDGAEITESVSLLIALNMYGAETHVFAPDMSIPTKDHRTGKVNENETRNVLTEAARIARGKIEDVKKLSSKDYDALAFAGGYGAASNLSNWSEKGAHCEVYPDIARAIKEFHADNKPIAAVCIAPTLVAKVLGSEGVELTIGDDKETAQEIEKTGARHIECPVEDYIADRRAKILTTPAYMYNAKPHLVFKGISAMVKELVEMA